MNLREMFQKEFLFESKKEDKKATKIFYKLDIKLKKKAEEPVPEQPAQPAPAPEAPVQEPAQDLSMDQGMGAEPMDLSMDQGMGSEIPMDNSLSAPPLPGEVPQQDSQLPPVPPLPASVVTEADDEEDPEEKKEEPEDVKEFSKKDNKEDIEINDAENIVRKLEGEIIVEREEIDNIQSIDDIMEKLTEGEKDGVKILDEFSADMLIALLNPATQQEVKQKVDKESKIFAEIIYGKKEEDSVGLRIIKRKNSEMVTMSMMLDNRIINAPYSKDILDKRIAEYRNNELTEE